MRNKRGQELSTNAIILIILGVLVLVALIVGFALGWGKIAKWFQKDNVNDVVDSCNSACTSMSVYDFCLRKRELNAEGTTYKNVTCNYLAQKETQFGVGSCGDLGCNNVIFTDCGALGANPGKTSQIFDSDNKVLNFVSCS